MNGYRHVPYDSAEYRNFAEQERRSGEQMLEYRTRIREWAAERGYVLDEMLGHDYTDIRVPAGQEATAAEEMHAIFDAVFRSEKSK